MGPSGRAGGPVKKNMRAEDIEDVSASRREDPSRCSQPAVVQILSATWFIHRLFTTRVHENGTHMCSRVYRDMYESKELVNGHRHHMPGKQFVNPARTL